jgi:hypothetical protein
LTSRWGTVAAIVIGLAFLLALSWFDAGVLVRAREEGGANFDLSKYSILWVIGSLCLAGAVLVLGGVAWWVHSLIVGAVYIVVGAIFTVSPIIILGNPTTLPSWANQTLGNLFVSSNGPMGAGLVLGAAMLISGIISIWRAIATRSAAAAS